MQNKNALIGMAITTVVFAALLVLGLMNIDPRTSQWLGFAAITLALFLFVWALVGTVLLAHKAIRKKDRPAAVSLRQASFLSAVVVLALYLSRFDLLTWWNVAVLVALVVLLEVYYIGKEEMQ